MIKFAILFLVDFIIYKYVGFIPALVGLAIIIYRLSNAIGFTRSIQIYKGNLNEGFVYTKDFTGSYKKIGDTFKKADDILKKFKMEKTYAIIGIYYDCPDKVPEGKQRASIGIYKKKSTDFISPNEDLDKYVLENGYKKSALPSTPSLYSDWQIMNMFSLLIGVKKFYKELNVNLENETFRNQYKVKSKEYKCSIELYDSQDVVKFYVPTTNEDKFMLHDTLKEEKVE